MVRDQETRASFKERLADEHDAVHDAAEDTQPLVEPTEEERRNGWTAETLSDYLATRRAGQSLAIDPNSLHRQAVERPRFTNSKYSPKRWRG